MDFVKQTSGPICLSSSIFLHLLTKSGCEKVVIFFHYTQLIYTYQHTYMYTHNLRPSNCEHTYMYVGMCI